MVWEKLCSTTFRIIATLKRYHEIGKLVVPVVAELKSLLPRLPKTLFGPFRFFGDSFGRRPGLQNPSIGWSDSLAIGTDGHGVRQAYFLESPTKQFLTRPYGLVHVRDGLHCRYECYVYVFVLA